MRRLVAFLVMAALLGACGGTDTGLRDEGAVAIGNDAVVSPAEAAVDGGSGPAIPTPAPGVAIVYFLRYDEPEPTRRAMPLGESVVEAGVNQLLAGPSTAERSLHYATAIPEDARLIGLSVRNRTAIVDLSALPDPDENGGSEALLALYQVVYTVTASGGVEAVQVRVNGRPYGLSTITGGSGALEPPLTRADLSFVVAADTLPGSFGCAIAKDEPAPATPTLAVQRPRDGANVAGMLQVRGRLGGPGGPIVIRILQDEIEVTNRIVDEVCRGRFSASLPIPRTLEGPVVVVISAPGAEDVPTLEVRRAVVIAGS